MFLCGEILVNWLFIYMIVSASDRVEAVEKEKKKDQGTYLDGV